tara:strand:- start:236 stop:763 length:528 start_codon:yes stop_codon:yes gene_type:complete
MELKYEVIDNFLDLELYTKIKLFLKHEKTPWFLREEDTGIPGGKSKNGFFSFCAYNHGMPDNFDFYNLSLPILSKLKCFTPIQIRANLTFRDIDSIESSWHKDHHCESGVTAILYFNTCNAKTVLKINDKIININSKENRLLKFNSPIMHKVLYHTDVHKRFVINFNYVTENGDI